MMKINCLPYPLTDPIGDYNLIKQARLFDGLYRIKNNGIELLAYRSTPDLSLPVPTEPQASTSHTPISKFWEKSTHRLVLLGKEEKMTV